MQRYIFWRDNLKKGLTILIFCFLIILVFNTMAYSKPIMVFSLHTWQEKTTGFVPELEKDFVYGISWRFGWNKIEPSDGEYNWKIVDETIAAAKKHNKKVMLRFTAGIHTPDWVYKAGAKKFRFSNKDLLDPENWKNMSEKDMPIPWDEIFLSRWRRFIKEAGKRYNNNTVIFSVQMTGGGWLGEMNLPKAYEKWRSEGYSDEKLIYAWKSIIDTYIKNFPDTPTNLDINEPLTRKHSNVLNPIVNYVLDKYPKKVYLQQNGLKEDMHKEEGTIRVILRNASQKTIVGYQMLGGKNWIDKDTGNRSAAFRNAVEDNASYIEIYPGDINDKKYKVLLQQLSNDSKEITNGKKD